MTRRRTAADRTFLLGAELGLLALSLGTVASLVRLFEGFRFLGRLLVPVIAAWAVAALLRRVGVGALRATVAHVVAGVLVLSWWFVPDTLLVVLPTPASAAAAGDLVRTAFLDFSELIAPVPAQDGFLLVIAAVLWVFAGFADTAALRFAAPVQAAVPATAAFVAVGILAREPGRLAAAVWFLVGLGIYAVAQRGRAGVQERWVASRSDAGARAVTASAAAVVVVAVVAGVVVGPRLPGDTEPVVDLRELGRGSAPRTVVSPFVGLRSLLGPRSAEVMFEVVADQPAYWRLTALEVYDPDREIWVSEAQRYRPVSGLLPPSLDASVPTESLRQQYRIAGLAGLWLPAAFAPAAITEVDEASYNEQSSSLYLRDAASPEGVEYVLESSLPRFGDLGGAGPPPPGAVPASLAEVPELDPVVVDELTSVTAAAATPLEQLLALQTWFREEFDYDEQVDLSAEPDPLVAFLDRRRGFCQQFSSAFSLMARALGLPSRVAVGFTPGDTDDGATFVVRGRHAHAWPEVFLDGVGWVPFEPTPQRGDPQSSAHTGVPPQQAPAPTDDTTTTTSTTPEPPPTAPPDTAPLEDLAATGGGSDPAAPPEEVGGDPGLPRVMVGLLGVTALLAGALVVLRYLGSRRRRSHTAAHRDRWVASAWRDAVRTVSAVGMRPRPAETPAEFAARVDDHLGTDALAPLAGYETERRYSAGAPDDETCHRAADHLVRLQTIVREQAPRRARLAAAVRS